MASDLTTASKARLSYLLENGLETTRLTQTLSAVGAPAAAAGALDLEPGAPVLSLIRRSYNKSDAGENLMDYRRVPYHAERVQYRMDLTLDS